jgi:hypothetical protein
MIGNITSAGMARLTRQRPGSVTGIWRANRS